jgi:hypothetical protein
LIIDIFVLSAREGLVGPILAAENTDNDFYHQLEIKKSRQYLDYGQLRLFIETNFPVYKREKVLKVAEYWRKLPAHQSEYGYYARRLSSKDINLLMEGIKTSITNR